MSLNPLTLLEKAINEHGSSVILKERLELVKDQLAKVVAENTELEEIQNKYHLLKTENSKLKGEIENLEEKIKKLKQPPSLSKDGLKILQYITNCNNLVQSSDIAEALLLKKSKQIITFKT